MARRYRTPSSGRRGLTAYCIGLLLSSWATNSAFSAGKDGAAGDTAESVDTVVSVPLFNDVHFHLTNYVQCGINARQYFEIVGDRVGRVAMFGIPLQQKWDYFISGDRAPNYYLLSDASLYYYSFVDAAIAVQYISLSDDQKARVDPMITGFNPTDIVRRRSHPPGPAHVPGGCSPASANSACTRSSCPRRLPDTRQVCATRRWT